MWKHTWIHSKMILESTRYYASAGVQTNPWERLVCDYKYLSKRKHLFIMVQTNVFAISYFSLLIVNIFFVLEIISICHHFYFINSLLVLHGKFMSYE